MVMAGGEVVNKIRAAEDNIEWLVLISRIIQSLKIIYIQI